MYVVEEVLEILIGLIYSKFGHKERVLNFLPSDLLSRLQSLLLDQVCLKN